jgi:hypothetical protein
MVNLKQVSQSVLVANGQKMLVTHIGNLPVFLKVNEKDIRVIPEKVLVFPNLVRNLISLRLLVSKGINDQILPEKIEFRNKNALLAIAQLNGSMYCMRFEFSNALAMISLDEELTIWHKCLGHCSGKKLQIIKKSFCDIK